MNCSLRYFAFNLGTYELIVKDLSRIVKVAIGSLKDVTNGALPNLNAWRCMKSQLMLGNESAIYLKVNDLSRLVKVAIESLKEVTNGATLNLNAWRCMKSQLMLGNEIAISTLRSHMIFK